MEYSINRKAPLKENGPSIPASPIPVFLPGCTLSSSSPFLTTRFLFQLLCSSLYVESVTGEGVYVRSTCPCSLCLSKLSGLFMLCGAAQLSLGLVFYCSEQRLFFIQSPSRTHLNSSPVRIINEVLINVIFGIALTQSAFRKVSLRETLNCSGVVYFCIQDTGWEGTLVDRMTCKISLAFQNKLLFMII